ncbi:MAG: 3-isopropylmalate dehydrogenase [Bacteroidota bacterium]
MEQIKHIALLPGDGIGPEVMDEALKVLTFVSEQFPIEFKFQEGLIGAIAIDQTGNPFPEETREICRASDAILFGAIGDPKFDNDPNSPVRPEQGLLALRRALGLFSNIRPLTLYPALEHLSPLKAARLENVDFVIYRELTGGIYFGDKQKSADGQSASDLCAYTAPEIERIAKMAFEAAKVRNKRVTLVDKANVLETSRLWRTVVQEMAKDYPEIELHTLFVDNAAMQLIVNPAQFDVILTSNMFGDILSDEASVLAGSLGLLPSASIGEKYALFEPVHGSFPEGAGKQIANPSAMILSAAMMLDYFQLFEAANLIRKAVSACFADGILTFDLHDKNACSTVVFGDAVVEKMAMSLYPAHS